MPSHRHHHHYHSHHHHHYHSHHHHHYHSHPHSSNQPKHVTERIFALPLKTDIPHQFSIYKKITKYGGWFENLFAQSQHQTVVKTNHEEFDSNYLLLTETNANTEQIIAFSLKLYPLLEKHLGNIKQIVVGQMINICTISFNKNICFIRFDRTAKDIRSYYNLASDLLYFS
ncbi:MAG: hypothetical protein QXL17_01705 [Candidatus Thermoplasmatota archaeon]